MMKIKIVAMLLLLTVLGTVFTGCNEKKEEDNLELVQESQVLRAVRAYDAER